MNSRAANYLAFETFMSVLFNAVLNCGAAFAVFHGRVRVPATGPGSLLLDTIGETSVSVFLSVAIALLVARHRRRAGVLPSCEIAKPRRAGNPYLQGLIAAVLFTVVGFAFNAWFLPLIFPNGASFSNVVTFKTVYGGLLGLVATFWTLYRALHEIG